MEIYTANFTLSKSEKIIFEAFDLISPKPTILMCSGGWVRDSASGKSADDIDLVCDYDSHAILEAELVMKIAMVANNHGIKSETISKESLTLKSGDVAGSKLFKLKVKLFSTSSEKTIGLDIRRLPQGGDLASDVMTRDFTVNAMYYDPSDDSLFDYVRSIKDLQSKTLRPTHTCTHIFKDEARYLRAIRFKTQHGYEWSPDLDSHIKIYGSVKVSSSKATRKISSEIIKLIEKGGFELALEHKLVPKSPALTSVQINKVGRWTKKWIESKESIMSAIKNQSLTLHHSLIQPFMFEALGGCLAIIISGFGTMNKILGDQTKYLMLYLVNYHNSRCRRRKKERPRSLNS